MAIDNNNPSISSMKYFILSRVGSEYSSEQKKIRVIELTNWSENYLRNTNVEVTSKYGGSISINLIYKEGVILFSADFDSVSAKPQQLTFIFNGTNKISISNFQNSELFDYFFIDDEGKIFEQFAFKNITNCKCIFEVGYLKVIEANISPTNISAIRELLNVRVSEDYNEIKKVYDKYKAKEALNSTSNQPTNKTTPRFASAGGGCLSSAIYILLFIVGTAFLVYSTIR